MTDTTLITPLQNNLVKEYLQIEHLNKGTVLSTNKMFYQAMVNSTSSSSKFQLDSKYQNNDFQLLNRTNILRPSIKQKRVQKNPFYAFQVFKKNLVDNIIMEEQKKDLLQVKVSSWDRIEIQLEQPEQQKNAFSNHVQQYMPMYKKNRSIRSKSNSYPDQTKLLTQDLCFSTSKRELGEFFTRHGGFKKIKVSEFKLPQTVKQFTEKKRFSNSIFHSPNLPMNQYLVTNEGFKNEKLRKKATSIPIQQAGYKSDNDYATQFQIFKRRALATKYKSNKRAEIFADPHPLSFEFNLPQKLKRNTARVY